MYEDCAVCVRTLGGAEGRSVVDAIRKLSIGLLLLGLSHVLRAQGTLTTSDGVRLSLSSSGAVSSLQVGGVEHRSSALGSGFYYRELPATVPNTAPNGSFESGTSTPTSWSWAGGTGGTWTWDTTGAVGSRSMKVSIPGTTAKRSPMLTSSTFAIAPNTQYTFSCQMKTSGLSTKAALYLVENKSTGGATQYLLTSGTGTTGWTALSKTYTSTPGAINGYFKAEIYSGYGTGWLDDVQLVDVFGTRKPAVLSGSVASDSGGLTETASASGLSLSARYTSVGTAIRVDATLTDTTGQDRPVELSYRLPLDVPGWTWEQNLVTSVPIVDGTRYENLDPNFGSHTYSMYPFATVRNGAAAAFSMAIPASPRMHRFTYDTSVRLYADVGSGAVGGGDEEQVEGGGHLLDLHAGAAVGTAGDGAEVLPAEPGQLHLDGDSERGLGRGQQHDVFRVDPQLQGLRLGADGGVRRRRVGQRGQPHFDLLHRPVGLVPRVSVSTTGGPQPSYSTLISALTTDAASGTGTTVNGAPVKEMAQAVINSSPYNELGQYQVKADSYLWYGNRCRSTRFCRRRTFRRPASGAC